MGMLHLNCMKTILVLFKTIVRYFERISRAVSQIAMILLCLSGIRDPQRAQFSFGVTYMRPDVIGRNIRKSASKLNCRRR